MINVFLRSVPIPCVLTKNRQRYYITIALLFIGRYDVVYGYVFRGIVCHAGIPNGCRFKFWLLHL